MGTWINFYKSLNLTFFDLLYASIAIATFRHSAIGFATLEDGNVWLGGLSALSVDIGLMVASAELRKRFNAWALAGLIVSGLASVYTQLLFGLSSASVFVVSDGSAWMGETAQVIGNWRVVILSVILPALAVVYAFSAKQQKVAVAFQVQQKVTWEEEVKRLKKAGLTGGALALALHTLADGKLQPAQIAELTGVNPSTVRAALSKGDKKK